MRGDRRRAAALASVVFLTLSACHPRQPLTTPSPAAPTTTRSARLVDLRSEIDAILNVPALGPGTWGVLIRSLATDETLYERNARKLLMPASNQKIVTLAAAAERLGWDYTYETRLSALGTVSAGTLTGDLVVTGSGDPSIANEDGSPQRVFRAWAEQLKAQGIRRITGHIIGDDNVFDDEGLGAGWMWDDLDTPYSAAIGALQLNEDATRLTITPGGHEGTPAVVASGTQGSGLTLRNNVVTTAPGTSTGVLLRRLAGSNVLEASGTIPLGSATLERPVAVDNPTLYFVAELKKDLVANGIDVAGDVVDIDALVPAPRVQDGVPIVSYRSPPLSVLADRLMKISQNQYAETLLKTLGAQDGSASFAAGLRVMRSVLEAWGVPPSDIVLADGSGLSRYNLITPAALVTILTHVDRDGRLQGPFVASLPIAGVAGSTLSDRLKDTAAAGLVQAKTGSMTNVRSISGYLRTREGEPLVFSIVANNYGIPSADVDRAADAILLKAAALTR